MSTATYTRSNDRSYQKLSDKKFCGVCHKKGLPESVYTSHFTKSVPGHKGIITCPTILNASCRFCGGKGHWADEKFCAAMRQENRDRDGFETVVRKRTVEKRIDVAPLKSTNVFACLDVDNDPVAPAPVAPAPVAPAHVATPIRGVSWASMASRPVALVKKEEKTNTLFVNLAERSKANAAAAAGGGKTIYYDSAKSYEPLITPESQREAFKIIEERKAEFANRPRCSWADSSSDEEDEEECTDSWDL
jgi:hypothetical protein